MISTVIIISNHDLYPIDAIIESAIPVSGEIIVNVDSESTGTAEFLSKWEALSPIPFRTIFNKWNWSTISQGHELARQTNLAIQAARGDWILDLQADECLHEKEHEALLDAVKKCTPNVSGFEFPRLYFYGYPNVLRLDWTIPLTRLFKRDSHIVIEESMNTQTLWGQVAFVRGINMYHYSRIGSATDIVKRIMRLSSLFHEQSSLHPPETYDFKTYKYDSYSTDNPPDEVDSDEVLIPFEGTHPAAIIKWYSERGLWPKDLDWSAI